ncbi:MAG: CHAT domain-containing protein [Mojavia pulchra JT2-VF2]|jgi:CHAT domain-containing protein|uniref:CHAT domain-containing protein n=1 Tax=Mojavia pulchra JT2-VF2 TaxID=287848 RepID=A0A951UH23_9NOST|nr:CHAT domain-containing protein [Mojavia pulchra JT2-VF2]
MKSKVVSSFFKAVSRRILKLTLLAVLAFTTTIGVPVLSAQQVEVVSSTKTQTTNAQLLLQQGIELYEAQKFSEAATVWHRAASAFAQQADNLKRALALSNLSLAYQELGQWEDAQGASTTSLNLLKNLENSAPSLSYWEILAKALNTQGSLEWAKGRLEEALSTWKQASATYAKAGNQAGLIGSSLNQAKALQALGLSRQAAKTLEQVNQILKSESDPSLKATGLRYLGNALRQIGALAESRQVLAQSVQLAGQTTTKALTLLELGNTERALSNRAIAIGKKQEEIEHAKFAINFYEEASKLGSQVQPQLNQLSLLIETGQWSDVGKLVSQVQQSIANLPLSRTAIYARLNLARSLTCLKSDVYTEAISCRSSVRREQLLVHTFAQETPLWAEIAQILATAVQQAHSLQDRRAESYALGQLGEVYQLAGQLPAARKLTEQALFIAQQIQAPEIRYRWEWQLGRLLAQQGNSKGAIASYSIAVDTLGSVRSNLLTINPDVQFSFRDQAEPVYRELVDLLLSPQGSSDPSQENLERAIATIDALQLAELENYLGCYLGQTVPLKQNFEQVSHQAAFIYPIILKDRLEVLFKLPGQPLRHFQHPVQQRVVKETVEKLRRAILGYSRANITDISQQVYQWLLEPLEPYLKSSSEVETLVFVLDTDLQNIPMAALYDGKAKEYLIEKKYALTLVPNAVLFNLTAKLRELKVLAAGISSPMEVENHRFDAINATAELQQIQQVASSSKILLNSQFTPANMQQDLTSDAFTVVHLATHGNFSSDPEQTFILAYNELLKSRDLENLLTSRKQKATGAIELLVLSACQTGEGDNRAPLGLAGLAVRSGANSTLGTLWKVSDESTVKLMEQFYKHLNQPGVSKGQALHRAQQALLKEPKYQNPYYWAPYVLVGNWL